jgi:hypothetical protein
MMKLKQCLVMAGVATLMTLGANSQTPPPAQDNNNNNNNGGPGRQGRGNFDPAQFQQRMMDDLKDQLEVTDDTEWKALEPLIQKVMDLRRDSMAGMFRGMGRRNRGGDNNQGDQNQQRRGGMFGTPSPEAETLQKAIDSKASKSEMKVALAKYMESRKAKQAELEKAQADLRAALTLRQEAIATMRGLL